MQEFINWGGETPEQLAERRRFEEEIREFTINKMLMEAARAQGKSASSAVGGSGSETVINPFNQTSMFVYMDSANQGQISYFAIDFENLRISEAYDTGLNGDDWNLDANYELNETGYVLVFRSINTNEYKFFCLDKFGAPVVHVAMGPSSDISYGDVNSLHFWAYDFDGSIFIAFNGTDFYQSTTILGENLQSITVGSANGSSPKDQLLVSTRNGQEVQINSVYLIDYVTEKTILTYEVSISDATYLEITADSYSEYLVVTQKFSDTGNPVGFTVLDLDGNGLATYVFDLEDPGAVVNVDYYGTNGSILFNVVTVFTRKIFFFDPTRSTDSFDIISVLNSEYNAAELSFYNRNVYSRRSNVGHNTAVVKLHKNLSSTSIGLHSFEAFAIVAKFEGAEPTFDTPSHLDSVLIYDSYQNADTILVPAISGDRFMVYTITRESRLVFDVLEGFGLMAASINSCNIYQIGNRFLYNIQYPASQWLFVYSTPTGTVLSEDSVVSGVGSFDHFSVNDVVLLFDRTGHHTYTISPTSELAWTQISDTFSTNVTTPTRYYSDSAQLASALVQIKADHRLYWFSDRGNTTTGNRYISDGGDDMYDSGNYINTNLNTQLPYTHVSMSDNGEISNITDFLMQSTVQDGLDYFGEGSEYFTNLYPGLFVMSAINPTTAVNDFYLDGNNGADSDGFVDSNQIILDNGYTVSYKRIWDTSDPSINQVIITKSTAGVPNQDISTDTDDTYHSIFNLGEIGLTEIHYLLFALADGHQVTEAQITNVSNAYISLISQNVNPNVAQGYLALLNSGYSSVVSQLPPHQPTGLDVRIITDSGDSVVSLPIGSTPNAEVGASSILIPYVNDADGLVAATLLDFTGTVIGQIQTEDTDYNIGYVIKDRALLVSSTVVDGVTYYTVHAINANGTVSKKFESFNGATIYSLINDAPTND